MLTVIDDAWLPCAPPRLVAQGLLAPRPLPAHVECVVPLPEQVRWVLSHLRALQCRQFVDGPNPRDHTPKDILRTLLQADLAPGHHHCWSEDRLISAGLFFHRHWGGPESDVWGASLLGTRGLWTFWAERRNARPRPRPPWAGLLERAYGHLLANHRMPPLPQAVDPPLVGVVPVLHLCWCCDDQGRQPPDPDDPEGEAWRAPLPLGPPHQCAAPGQPRLVLRRWQQDPLLGLGWEIPALHASLEDVWRARRRLLAAGLPPLGGADWQERVLRRVLRHLLRRLCVDWDADPLDRHLGDWPLHLPAPAVQFATPTVCDDCLHTDRWEIPVLCRQEAWAVVLTAAWPLDDGRPLDLLPSSPRRLFDQLLDSARLDDRLTHLAGLRVRHVPSRVHSGQPQGSGALGWRPGSQRAWGPVLGRSVLVHAAPPHLGGERARCYSLLTTGGLVTLVVRVAHAHLWREEARRLGWGPVYRPLWPAPAQPDDDGQPAPLPGPPDKVYWWPAALAPPGRPPSAQEAWGWSAHPPCPLLEFHRLVAALAAGRGAPVTPPQPAALVYVWTPDAAQRLPVLRRLAERQRDFLRLCARVRHEAGRHPAARLDPAACFYGGCRGGRPRVPLACVSRGRPGQVLCGGTPPTRVVLPGPGDDDRLGPDDDRRRLYLSLARLLASGGPSPSPASLLGQHPRHHPLFLRAALAEMTPPGRGEEEEEEEEGGLPTAPLAAGPHDESPLLAPPAGPLPASSPSAGEVPAAAPCRA